MGQIDLAKENRRLKAFGFFQVPLIGFASPKLVKLTEEEAVVKVALNWRTRRRDIKSMYLGALAIGADIASGIMAFSRTGESKNEFSIIFKNMHCDFLKRPEADVFFRCADGKAIEACMAQAVALGTRQSTDVTVIATCPKTSGDEPIAKFVLALTIKLKPGAK